MRIKMDNQDPTSKNKHYQRDSLFWSSHPFWRGLGAGLISPNFTSGALFGFMSGLLNVALHSLIKEPIKLDASNPAKITLTRAGLNNLPWIASAGIMHQAYKKTGESLFRINPFVAVVTAVFIECLGDANKGEGCLVMEAKKDISYSP